MTRSLFARAAAALALTSLVLTPAAPALAQTASTITVKDGLSASQTLGVGSVAGKLIYEMYGADASGNPFALASAATQALMRTDTQTVAGTVGTAGSPAATAQTVQPPSTGFTVNAKLADGSGNPFGTPGNPLNISASPRYTDAVTVQQAPAVTSGSAYASGQIVGSLLTFAAASRNASGNGTLQDVVLAFKSQQTSSFDLLIFSASPTGTTVTDKATLSLAASDVAKLVATMHVGACSSYGTPSACEVHNQGVKFTADASTNLYGILVARGTPTFASTSDLTVQIGAERNY